MKLIGIGKYNKTIINFRNDNYSKETYDKYYNKLNNEYKVIVIEIDTNKEILKGINENIDLDAMKYIREDIEGNLE